MRLRSLKDIKHLAGKHVLVRVDFNVPIKNKKVTEDSRLLASLPTIQYLRKKKAKIILVTHVGRPEGEMVPALQVDPIVKRLRELLRIPVTKLETRPTRPNGLAGRTGSSGRAGNWKLTPKQHDAIRTSIEAMKPGEIAMLENIRFSPEEERSGERLARQLAALGDIFVQECFAVAHRESASISVLPRLLPHYAGLLLQKEVAGLTRLMKRPQKPFVAILGGIKMETKIPVIKKLLPIVDNLLLGGGIVNTYLHARGYGVGKSLLDQEFEKDILAYGGKQHVILPVDCVVGNAKGTSYRVADIGKEPHDICKKGEAIFDIGPATIQLFASYIKQARTLVWNGAVGYFEQKPYDTGSKAIARLVASRSKGQAYGVIGGGETLQIMDMVGHTNDIDLVSTGGGAMLEFLAGKKLPGIEAVRKR